MKSDIKEFIDDEGGIINSKIVQSKIDPTATSHSTTDKYMRTSSQPFTMGNYRRYYGESTLPYNDQADSFKDNPEEFYKFLKKKGEEGSFKKYFTKDSPKKALKEVSRLKVYEIIDNIFSKDDTKTFDVFDKGDPRSIEEIKSEERLIIDKLEKIAEYLKDNLNYPDRKVIINYFTKKVI